MGPDSFRVLTTCSWEQSDTMVKVYVPLRGVQTDMLRANFTPNSVEVRLLWETPSSTLSNVTLCSTILGHRPEVCVIARLLYNKCRVLLNVLRCDSWYHLPCSATFGVMCTSQALDLSSYMA